MLDVDVRHACCCPEDAEVVVATLTRHRALAADACLWSLKLPLLVARLLLTSRSSRRGWCRSRAVLGPLGYDLRAERVDERLNIDLVAVELAVDTELVGLSNVSEPLGEFRIVLLRVGHEVLVVLEHQDRLLDDRHHGSDTLSLLRD